MITGGARGLGRAIAERLAGDGLEVMLCDLDLDEARRAAAEMPGGAASAIGLDVADEDAV
ncbi:MAG: SDR family NAD(P)-dependent oxidoreductase, partial [Sphingomonas bacterium]